MESRLFDTKKPSEKRQGNVRRASGERLKAKG
jgi:hypothetical protein